MSKNTRILAINGSYRDGGITDQSVESIGQYLRSQGAEVEHIRLRDYPIEFCLNCRQCMQQPGEAPGREGRDQISSGLGCWAWWGWSGPA